MDGLSGRRESFSAHICEACGSGRIEASTQEQSFQYGAGEDEVTLTVQVPVWSCDDCGISYTDDSAEQIRHEAVCVHLGRLPPRQLVAIRKSYGLSQDQFAELTSIGIASIKRWESGNQIQNASLDKLVRLLRVPENVGRLLDEDASSVVPVFRTPISKSKRREAAEFRLRVSERIEVDG